MLPFHMEAWMPEQIAIMKLRGFVHDAGGEVVESVPGLIKVRLGGRKRRPSGALAWLGLGRRSGGSTSNCTCTSPSRRGQPADRSRPVPPVASQVGSGRRLARPLFAQIFVELPRYLSWAAR